MAGAETYPRPDVEALVWSRIKGYGQCTSWAYAANDARTPPGWLSVISVQVDSRHRYKQGAYLKADMIRRDLLDLPGSFWTGGVVNRVDVVEGPFWNPDIDGKPRYTARYEITAHPHRVPFEQGAHA